MLNYAHPVGTKIKITIYFREIPARGFQRKAPNRITVLPYSCSYCTANQNLHVADVKRRPLFICLYSHCFHTQNKVLSILRFFLSSPHPPYLPIFLYFEKTTKTHIEIKRNKQFLICFLNLSKFRIDAIFLNSNNILVSMCLQTGWYYIMEKC